MAISKETLCKMRENSAAAAARQRAREQAELKKYMENREVEMAKTMSAKERDAAVIKAAGEGVPVMSIAARFGLSEDRVLKIIGKPAGVVDAAELNPEERAELTAQAERDAGITAAQPDKSPETDIVDVARYIKRTLQKALGDVPETVRVDFRISEGLCELEIADAADSNNTATLTWR